MAETLTRVNWLDILIILALAGGMLLGFMQGLLRQLLILGALLVSLVLAAQYYQLAYLYVRQLEPTMVETVAQVFTFFLLLFVLVVALTILLADVMHHVLPGQKQTGSVSRMLGGALGLVVASLFITISLIGLTFMTITVWPGTGETVRLSLVNARQGSDFVAVFRQFFPLVLQIIRPWVPALPPIFSIDVGSV